MSSILLWVTLLLALRPHQASAQAAPTPTQPPAAPTASAQTPPAPATLRRETTIPDVPVLSGLEPLIQVTIDGKVTGTFMVDTGTNACIISKEIATKLGLTPQSAVRQGYPPLFQGKPTQSVVLALLQIGTLPLSNQVFITLPRSQMGPFGAVDGVIGNNLLEAFAVLFNFPAHRITLWYPAGLSPAEVRAAGFDPANAVPITDPNNYWMDDVNVDFKNNDADAKAELAVDTGADVITISASTAKQLKLIPNTKGVANIYGGPLVVSTSIVPSMQLGKLKLSDQSVAFPQHDTPQLPLSLGMNVLSRYRVLLDYKKAMYLQPALPPALTIHIGPTPTAPLTAPPTQPAASAPTAPLPPK